MRNHKLNKKGFTLIEVVLVLAIGGLIFLLAFLAFQQATKNRRDSQRRSDASRVISELENAAGDANGKALGTGVPNQTTINDFVKSYLSGDTSDPVKFTSNNITYTVQPRSGTLGSMSASTGWINVSNNVKCNGNAMADATGDGNYAVVAKLEKGQVCRDNQ